MNSLTYWNLEEEDISACVFQQPVLTKRAADSAACARVPKPPLQQQRCYAGAAALLYDF
jgi:hypothetical protein